MKTLITAITAALFATTALAQGIAVGQEGRGYEARGKQLMVQLTDSWTVNFSGSEDIARAVCNDPDNTPIGIAQIDAIYAMEQEGCKLFSIMEYPVKEYAFVLFPPGGYNELDDLNSSHSILVDEPGSGTALFWNTIVAIEAEYGNGSKWAEVSPVYQSTVFAESLAASGEIDAVLIVGDPNSAEVWELLKAGWNTGELQDKDINDLPFRKSTLYFSKNVTIDPPGPFNKDTENAIEVRSFWIVNPDWMKANLSETKRITRLLKSIK